MFKLEYPILLLRPQVKKISLNNYNSTKPFKRKPRTKMERKGDKIFQLAGNCKPLTK